MKNIVVTGGCGFIGTNLIHKLKNEFKCDIRVLDDLSNVSGDLKTENNIDIIVGDIRNKEVIEDVLTDTDILIHLAAHTRVVDSVENPGLNFNINVNGTFILLEAARHKGVDLIVNASTGGAILGDVEPPVHEEIPPRPVSPYGASKLAVEAYCSAYAQTYGMKITSLRFSNIYGPHCRNKDSVIAAFIKKIINDGEVTVYGDGTQTRDYLYVEDLADGIINAINKKCTDVYQLGSGKPTTVNEIIEILKNIVDRDFEVNYQDFRVGEIKHNYSDITKARKSFGFNPKMDIQSGIQKTWNWFISENIL